MEVSQKILQSRISEINLIVLSFFEEVKIVSSFLNKMKASFIQVAETLTSILPQILGLHKYEIIHSLLLDFVSLLKEISCKMKQFNNETISNYLKIYSGIDEIEKNTTCPNLLSKSLKCVNNQINNSFNLSLFENHDVNQLLQLCVEPTNINHILLNDSILLANKNKKFLEHEEENSSNIDCKFKESVKSITAKSDQVSLCLSTPTLSNDSVSLNPTFEDTNYIKKTEKSKSNFIKEIDLEKKQVSKTVENFFDVFEVTVEHIQSPSEFYVLFKYSCSDLINKLQQKLRKIPIKNESTQNKKKAQKLQQSKKIGTHALYYSISEEVWFRAEIIDWRLKENDLVFIFLIDMGISKWVSYIYLEPMPEDLKMYPNIVQKCHLGDVVPLNLLENEKKWSRDASEKMKLWIERSSKIRIQPLDNKNNYDSSSISVILWLADQDKSVNQLLVENNLAKEIVQEKCVELNDKDDSSDSLENWNPMKEDFESSLNEYGLDVDNPSTAVYNFCGTDHLRACFPFANTRKCYKGNSCKKDHLILNPVGYTVDKELVYTSAFNRLPCPSVNEIIAVEITYVVSINHFYCVAQNLEDEDDIETLLTLTKYINSKSSLQEMRKLEVPPSPGQIVLAKYSLDNAWHRGKVLDCIPEKDSYVVSFVDYGDVEKLSLYQLRSIHPKYLHLPFQSMSCRLCGIDSECSSKDGIKYFYRATRDRLFNVEVVSILPGDEVCLLVNLYDEDGKSFAEELVSENFAAYKRDIIVCEESELLPG